MICALCKKDVLKMGLHTHVRKVHAMDYGAYKREHMMKKCLICGTFVNEYRKFCSQECYHKAVILKIVKKKYKEREPFDQVLLKEMVAYYQKDPRRTYSDVSKEFGVSLDMIGKTFRDAGIKARRGVSYMSNLNREKFRVFCKTTGMEMAQKYEEIGGTLRKLEREYGFTRRYIRRVLKALNVPIKTCKEAKRGVDRYKRQRGIRGGNYGKKPPAGTGFCHWFLHEGIKYQGSWEFRMGLWLKKNNVSFLCHRGVRQFPYVIDNEDHTYCPDFYIPGQDYFIEVKGYFPPKQRRKISIIRKSYPDIKLEVYDKERLEANGILNIDRELGLNVKDFILKKSLACQ